MSKRCPECRNINDDSRSFCAFCGATLDPHIRLIQDLEKQKDLSAEPETDKKRKDVNFYTSHSAPKEEKKSPLPWVLLGLLVVAGIAIWFFTH